MQKLNTLGNRITRISKIEEIKKSGIPVGYDDNSIYLDCKESHTLVIGSTGSGKTQSIVLPEPVEPITNVCDSLQSK